MDVLGYDYDNGNKLLKVTDTGNGGYGFIDRANQMVEFTYDQNGNLLTDVNKGVTGIQWNHLNMPTEITISNPQHNGSISYVYSADGIKLQKTVNENTNSTITDYAGAYQYVNNDLEFIRNIEDGYVYPNNDGSYGYMYYYTDQLDNIRLMYSDADANGSIDPSTEIVKEAHFYPFGMKLEGFNGLVQAVGSDFHKYDYQNQERQDELGLNRLQFKYRMHDPTIGRFVSIDPLAEDYTHNSTYAFAENKVIKYNELEGLEITLNKFDRLGYEDKSWLGKAATFVGNSGISIANGAIDVFNYAGDLTDPEAPLTGLSFGANKLADDTTATAGAIADYAENTTLSEFGDDVGEALSSVETYENIAGSFVAAGAVSKLGKLGSISKSGKAGSSGGPGAGKAFSKKTKDLAEQQAKGKCEYCGTKTTRQSGPTQRNTDHINPKSRNGNNTIDNADNTCRSCNQQKRARTKQEFRRDLKNGERLRSNGG